jgi:hypothetical protein
MPHARRWGSILIRGDGGVIVSIRPKICDLFVSHYKSHQAAGL